MSGIKKNAAAFVSETCRGRLFIMLSPKAQLSLRNAKEYFREHLDVGDYYAEGQKVKGEWFGAGAEKLGLNGPVKEAEFLALCEGLHPVTGEQLTARKNSREAFPPSVHCWESRVTERSWREWPARPRWERAGGRIAAKEHSGMRRRFRCPRSPS